MLVGIEGDRLAVLLQIGPCRLEIIESALALDKLQMHQPAGRIVNVDEQGALRPTGLEPPVLRAIDLDQLTDTLAAIARLMNRLHPLLAILPKPGCHHPLPDRLAAKTDAMKLRELLGSKRRPKVALALANEANDLSPQAGGIAPVAPFGAPLGHQRRGAALPIGLRQP